jgi:hypothetical protein
MAISGEHLPTPKIGIKYWNAVDATRIDAHGDQTRDAGVTTLHRNSEDA